MPTGLRVRTTYNAGGAVGYIMYFRYVIYFGPCILIDSLFSADVSVRACHFTLDTNHR